jgi:hypothetical protein
VCVFLCTVFRLIVVIFGVMCVVCVLCLIVGPLPPGENPFAVKMNIYLSYSNTTWPNAAETCRVRIRIRKISCCIKDCILCMKYSY